MNEQVFTDPHRDLIKLLHLVESRKPWEKNDHSLINKDLIVDVDRNSVLVNSFTEVMQEGVIRTSVTNFDPISIPTANIGMFPRMSEEENIIQRVRDIFSQFKEVGYIFYSPYMEGLRFLVLLTRRFYDQDLLDRLYARENQLRKNFPSYSTIPFEVNYAFNIEAFDINSAKKDMNLIHEK